MILFDCRQAADARAHDDPHPLCIGLIDDQARFGHGHLGCGQRIMDKDIHFLLLFLVNIGIGVKTLHLTGNL